MFDDSLEVLTHARAQSSDVADEVELAAPRAAQSQVGVSRLHGQFSRYLRAMAWVARDALPRWKLHVAAIVICNLIGLTATMAAVGGVMAYARAAESKEPVHVLGMTLHLGLDLRSLLTFGAVIAGLGLVSAACIYLVDRLILMLAARYHALCAERALMIAADPLCRGWQIMDDEPPRAILSRLVGGTSRVMGLVLRNMLRAILPLLTVVATIAFLFYIDSGLTLALLPATLLYLVPLYLINRRVTRMQRRYRELSSPARGELSRRLRDMLDSGELESGAESLRADALRSDVAEGARAAFYGRLLADRRVHLLNSAFFIACLVALLIFFGVRARDQGGHWSDLIFYLLALRYAMMSLKQVTGLGAKFSRFFHDYSTYARFVSASESTRLRRAAALNVTTSPPGSLRMRLGKQARWDSPRAVSIARPGMVLVAAPTSLGFTDLEAIALRMEQRLDDDIDLTTRGLFIADVDGAARWSLDNNQTLWITAAIAGRSNVAERIVSGLRSRNLLCVIVSDDPSQLLTVLEGSDAPTSAIVMDGTRAVAGGDRAWLAENVRPITEFISQQFEASRRRGISAEIDDVDDDGEDEE